MLKFNCSACDSLRPANKIGVVSIDINVVKINQNFCLDNDECRAKSMQQAQDIVTRWQHQLSNT